jgi:hypothetical protein
VLALPSGRRAELAQATWYYQGDPAPAGRDQVARRPAAPGRLMVFVGAPGTEVTAPLLADVRRDLDQIPVASRVNITLVVFADPGTVAPLLARALDLRDPERTYAAQVRGIGAGPGPAGRAMEVIWVTDPQPGDGQPGEHPGRGGPGGRPISPPQLPPLALTSHPPAPPAPPPTGESPTDPQPGAGAAEGGGPGSDTAAEEVVREPGGDGLLGPGTRRAVSEGDEGSEGSEAPRQSSTKATRAALTPAVGSATTDRPDRSAEHERPPSPHLPPLAMTPATADGAPVGDLNESV